MFCFSIVFSQDLFIEYDFYIMILCFALVLFFFLFFCFYCFIVTAGVIFVLNLCNAFFITTYESIPLWMKNQWLISTFKEMHLFFDIWMFMLYYNVECFLFVLICLSTVFWHLLRCFVCLFVFFYIITHTCDDTLYIIFVCYIL